MDCYDPYLLHLLEMRADFTSTISEFFLSKIFIHQIEQKKNILATMMFVRGVGPILLNRDTFTSNPSNCKSIIRYKIGRTR